MIELLQDPPKSDTRTCATCACAMQIPDPKDVSQKQWCCRRDPPRVQDQRIRIPDPSDASRKRQVEAVQRVFFHQPTLPDATCFDGWRPHGVQPGEPWGILQAVDAVLSKR